jgi:hypothetical protein
LVRVFRWCAHIQAINREKPDAIRIAIGSCRSRPKITNPGAPLAVENSALTSAEPPRHVSISLET